MRVCERGMLGVGERGGGGRVGVCDCGMVALEREELRVRYVCEMGGMMSV